jgi:hypothetical protein
MRFKSLVLTTLVLLSCSDPAGPRDLSIVIAASAASLRPGEHLTVTVSVLNTSSRVHAIQTNSCPRPFDVFDPAGNEVAPMDQLCSASLQITTLDPGDTYTFTSAWTGETTSFSSGTTVRQPVPPGTYTLRGTVTAGGLGVLEGGLAQVVILP